MTLILDQITRDVSLAFGVPMRDIKGQSRFRKITMARHAVFWVIRQHMELTYPQIGRIFGIDHTSVLTAVNRVNDKWLSDPFFCEKIEPVIKKYARTKEQVTVHAPVSVLIPKTVKRLSVVEPPANEAKPTRKERTIPYFRNPNPFKPKLVKTAGGWNVRGGINA